MLTTLHLENFKGITDRQRIDFAPLTLLFGPNSAGKSSILQSLLYLHELLVRGDANVDRTELGGTVVELGGFKRLVHGHDPKRAIVIRADFETPGSLERLGRDLSYFPFPDLDDEVESAWVELTIRMRTTATFHGPIVERVVIGVGSTPEPLVWLEVGASLREGEPLYARVDLGHPLLAEASRALRDAALRIAIPEHVLPTETETEADEEEAPGAVTSRAHLGFDASHPVPVFALSRSRLSALPPLDEPLRVIPFGDAEDDDEAEERVDVAHEVRTFFEMIVLGTTAQLAASLQASLYIGPLRTIPPRGFLFEHAGRTESWANGLAAWDLLLADRTDLVARTNAWLRTLGVDCQLVVQELFDATADAEELSAGHVDKTTRRLLLDTGTGTAVLPSEVGAGISQIVPVIVAALHVKHGIPLIEQPELHVHPAVQVGLGDLFIEAALRDGARQTTLVETHSEHLILRVLRRIRQTHDHELPPGAPPFSPSQLSVLYVEQGPHGVRIYRLRVDEEGDFKDHWPRGFFAERREELR